MNFGNRSLFFAGLFLMTSIGISGGAYAETGQAPDGPVGLSCRGPVVPNVYEPSKSYLVISKFIINSDKTDIEVVDPRDSLDDFKKTDRIYSFATYTKRNFGGETSTVRLIWSINRITLQATVQQLELDLIEDIPVYDPRNRNRGYKVRWTSPFSCQVIQVDAPI